MLKAPRTFPVAPLALPLLLLAVGLAGCLSDDDGGDGAASDLAAGLREGLTQPIYEVLGHFEATFDGTLGTQLYVDYYLPTGVHEDGVPTILKFTPYQDPDLPEGDGGEGEGPLPLEDPPYSASLVEYFVPRGYAVAFADVRGNHNAGGCIDQTGPEQWQDGYDYVEWLAAQDWSNGNVGMHGASYDGETQFTTAMMDPPGLKTIVPVASVSNQYDWSFYRGVPYELQPTLGMVSYLAGSVVPSTDPENALLYPEKLECQQEAMAAGLDHSGDRTDFWAERDYRPMAANITASVLHVHGFADWNVRPIHIDPLFNDIQSEKRGLFGQWRHAYPDREDWDGLLNAWYDHFLLGRDNGILDILPPVLVEDDTEQWWGHEAFPPLDQPWLPLELGADGVLSAPGDAAAAAGDLEIVDYPEEVLSNLGLTNVEGDGVVLDAPDSLTFTWKTDQELRLLGRPYLELNLTTDTTSTHWAAVLSVDGHACQLNGGGQAVCTNAGYQDTRHRDGEGSPSDLTPDERYPLRIDFYPQYDVIPAGATLRLTLSNNTPDITQDPTFARSLVHLGDGGAVLHLPLDPGGVPLPHDELPGAGHLTS
ncbi:MAG: CocE/NonD family hydrolase [Thermoplasmatota archaeon]